MLHLDTRCWWLSPIKVRAAVYTPRVVALQPTVVVKSYLNSITIPTRWWMFCWENHPDMRTGHQHHPPSRDGPSIDKPSTNYIFVFHINVLAVSTLHEIFSSILVHFTLDTVKGSRLPFQPVYTQMLQRYFKMQHSDKSLPSCRSTPLGCPESSELQAPRILFETSPSPIANYPIPCNKERCV